METDPTARALTLLALLQSGAARSGADLARRLGVSARTVRRDAERLRRLGYVVHARPGPGGTYRLLPGVTVPPLLFDADEVTAVVGGLRLLHARLPDDDAAARALAKLDRVLPARLRQQLTAADLALEVLEEGPPGVTATAVAQVADAIAADGRLRFGYRDRSGRTATRLVDPHRHVLRQGQWYLVGYDLGRRDWRVYRFDRVTAVERVPGTYRRPAFPDESVARWFDTDLGRTTPEPP